MQPGKSRQTVRLSVSSWQRAAVIEIIRLIHGNLDIEQGVGPRPLLTVDVITH